MGQFLVLVYIDFNNLSLVAKCSGNVAQYTCEKLLDLGAKPITLSDSNGFIIVTAQRCVFP